MRTYRAIRSRAFKIGPFTRLLMAKKLKAMSPTTVSNTPPRVPANLSFSLGQNFKYFGLNKVFVYGMKSMR
jgi:hypothetical protein